MEMETTLPAHVSWVWISDQQLHALQSAWQHWVGGPSRQVASSDNGPLPLPMLDWPSTLFTDEVVSH
jgi:hypothetical protein